MFQIPLIVAIWLVLEPAVINCALSMVDIVPKTPIAERLCTQCSLNAVEDECHFLMICPKYVAQRARITKHLNSNKNIASQTYMSKFNWILSNEDPVICKNIACFTTECFALTS